MINFDECSDIGTHWVDLDVINDDATYFYFIQSTTFSKKN